MHDDRGLGFVVCFCGVPGVVGVVYLVHPVVCARDVLVMYLVHPAHWSAKEYQASQFRGGAD